jgi:8-oxo-dGTP pyrophosphatase MutT (NUDIX family)
MEREEWVDWINTKTLQKAVVIDEHGNSLALWRTDNGPGARKGMPDLPGGNIGQTDLNTTETSPHELAIKREIKEETGLEVSNLEVIYIDSGNKQTQSAGEVLVLALGYRCCVSGIEPEVTLSDEHKESKWITKEEFLQLDFGNDGGFHAEVIKRA